MQRVLPLEPVTSLDEYVANDGGAGLDAARAGSAEAAMDLVDASGLRGRGGAGFPTGRKWRTVAAYASPVLSTSVVVNGAEGEPGSFKDRMLLRTDPYRVIEGALIAAHALAAHRVVIAVKERFAEDRARTERAIDEVRSAGWLDGGEHRVDLVAFGGPSEYLFGEETALLEAIDGREPFPRIAPPWRHGITEVGDGADTAAGLQLATSDAETVAPPTLANNVETMAHVATIFANGPDWFRERGTDASPGTIVCTVTGSTKRHGVVEVPMGTPLAAVIEEAGGGLLDGVGLLAVLCGVSHALLPGDRVGTPLTYEDMAAAGAGLGTAGFVVIGDDIDPVAVVHGVSRFLSVESCGQCTPCKRDGLEISDHLDKIRRSDAHRIDVDAIAGLASTVADGARCSLATQHQVVAESLLDLFPDQVDGHVDDRLPAAQPYLVAPIVDIVDGRAVLDEDHARKQPDWTSNDTDSGAWPAARIDERAEETY